MNKEKHTTESYNFKNSDYIEFESLSPYPRENETKLIAVAEQIKPELTHCEYKKPSERLKEIALKGISVSVAVVAWGAPRAIVLGGGAIFIFCLLDILSKAMIAGFSLALAGLSFLFSTLFQAVGIVVGLIIGIIVIALIIREVSGSISSSSGGYNDYSGGQAGGSKSINITNNITNNIKLK